MKVVHRPVLVNQVVGFLQPTKMGAVYLDGTVGLGGHASAILEASTPGGRLIGIDRDAEALAVAKETLYDYRCRCALIQGNFASLYRILAENSFSKVDGVLLDLGVSSLQLDTASRGFSFAREGRLDMRMDKQQSLSAAQVVNGACEHELTDIFTKFGEERWAKRIAQRIGQARRKKRITTTRLLAEIVEQAIPHRQNSYSSRIHPATKVFQALRIYVNNELENLATGLDTAVSALKLGGRICVISFHSLEDRIVKRRFRDLSRQCICPPKIPTCVCRHVPSLKPLTKRPITPTPEEVQRNPRSRSAKLRVAVKISES